MIESLLRLIRDEGGGLLLVAVVFLVGSYGMAELEDVLDGSSDSPPTQIITGVPEPTPISPADLRCLEAIEAAGVGATEDGVVPAELVGFVEIYCEETAGD